MQKKSSVNKICQAAKDLRRFLQLSQETMAGVLSCTRLTVAKFEGTSAPTGHRLKAYSDLAHANGRRDLGGLFQDELVREYGLESFSSRVTVRFDAAGKPHGVLVLPIQNTDGLRFALDALETSIRLGVPHYEVAGLEPDPPPELRYPAEVGARLRALRKASKKQSEL